MNAWNGLKLTRYWLNVSIFLNLSFKQSEISLRMIHGKCSRSPFTVAGQNIQRSCHIFSLEFGTLLALQAAHVAEG